MKKVLWMLFCVIAFTLLSYIGIRVYHTTVKNPKKDVELPFPDNIQNVYYVSSINVPNPVVTKIAGRYYILPESTLLAYDGRDTTFLNRSDVLRFYDKIYLHERYFDTQMLDMEPVSDIELLFHPIDTIATLPVYQFYYSPKDFMLIMLREFERVCVQEPDVWDIRYMKNYMHVLFPRFARKELKKMKEKYEETYFRPN